MTTYRKITAFLDQNNVKYRVVDHLPAGSTTEHNRIVKTKPEQGLKALFVKSCKNDQIEFIICVVPAHLKLDLKKVKTALVADKVEFGSEQEMIQLTSCKFGTLPPIGEIFSLRIIVDPKALIEPELCFNAGELTKSVFLSNSEYEKLVTANIKEIAR